MGCCPNRAVGRTLPPSTVLDFVSEKSPHNPGNFREAWFTNSRSQNLRVYAVSPVGEVRGVAIMHHGIRGHGLWDALNAEPKGGPKTTYLGSVSEMFVKQGYAFYTYDCEGHGLSEGQHGLRGYFNNVWDLVTDLLQLTGIVCNIHGIASVLLCGFSMGGGICVGAAIKQPELVKGLVLGAPMVSIEQVKNDGLNPYLIVVAPPLLRRCPCLSRWRLVAFKKNPDELMQKAFEEDPLTESSSIMLAGPAFACLLYCDELVTRLQELTVPFLTLHDKADDIVDFESSAALVERSASKDMTLLEAPEGSGHEIFAADLSRVWAQHATLDWLKSRA